MTYQPDRLANLDKVISRKIAVIVPVGPSPAELARAADVLQSLFFWEPENVGSCVIMDDAPRPSGLAEFPFVPASCRAVSIINPRLDEGRGTGSRLTVGVMAALNWIHANEDPGFILKIDSDALVIGEFVSAIRMFLMDHPDAGIVGTLGNSCNPVVRPLQDLREEPALLLWRRLLPRAPLEGDGMSDPVPVPGLGRVPVHRLRAFDIIRPHIDAAVECGYNSSQYCQGGAYVVTRPLLDRMAAREYFKCDDAWIEFPINEDMVMAMYVRALGLELYDFSGPGEPFGVQCRALPYPPPELVSRGHKLIHSVKNDPRFDERGIRTFFRNRMASHASSRLVAVGPRLDQDVFDSGEPTAEPSSCCQYDTAVARQPGAVGQDQLDVSATSRDERVSGSCPEDMPDH